MHLVKYKPEQGEINPGIAQQLGLAPFFYGSKAKDAVLAFPSKIDIEQIQQIPAMSIASQSDMSVALGSSLEKKK